MKSLARIATLVYGQTTPEQSWRLFRCGVLLGMLLGVAAAFVFFVVYLILVKNQGGQS